MIAPILLGVGSGVTTTIGGFVALRVTDRRHLVLGAAGGVVLGVVAFDLLPEAFDGSHAKVAGVPATMLLFVAGFLTIHTAEKAFELHRGSVVHYARPRDNARRFGLLAGGALVGHSFLDGLGIGLSFSAGSAVATVVAIAVLAHDFADGFNTFTLTAMYGNSRGRALTLLVADALAPIAGAAVGSVIFVSSGTVALLLAYFAGFLLYIATSKILPEAHANHPSWGTLAATVLGVVFMGIVISVVN
ncbi:ZIP family metal transporter [Actinoplanes sp. TBRC 11911]|uniref:ZIP family metal transporter n=1 Tax=Actinoplanes sp. TBRC 11911 TaxID=2729386 RepID=UPI00145D1C55|nr:ZIP family metal transporter [Actinoplanes sp. TBRC 11911]NMO55214.1 ZIP family metal transporter [Actinoplanes sp. TBRC 11911]